MIWVVFMIFVSLLALLVAGGALWAVDRRLDEACSAVEESSAPEPPVDHP